MIVILIEAILEALIGWMSERPFVVIGRTLNPLGTPKCILPSISADDIAASKSNA